MNKRNMDRARRALARLKPEDRRVLLREFGDCTCTGLAKQVAERPAIAIGAVVGGILGAFLSGKVETVPPEEFPRLHVGRFGELIKRKDDNTKGVNDNGI